MAAAKIALRSVQECDNEFLLKVYGSTREQELAQVPWTAEQKQQFAVCSGKRRKTITRRSIPTPLTKSYISTAAPPDACIWPAAARNFTSFISRSCRNIATGRRLFSAGKIMAEAKEAGKPVTIYVETLNPSLRLFERLGFTPIQQEGFHLLLQYAG